MAINQFTEGQLLTAAALNKVVDQANKIEAQEFTGTVTLKSANGVSFLLTVTDAGLEIKKSGAVSPAVTIGTDGSLQYARKTLRIIARVKPAATSTVFTGGSANWNGIGTYRISDRGTLGGHSITGGNTVRVFKEGSTYKYTIYNSDGSTVGTYTGTSSGIIFYAISTCTVTFNAESPSDLSFTYDGSANVTCDLTQIIASTAMAMALQSEPQTLELTDGEPVVFSELQED